MAEVKGILRSYGLTAEDSLRVAGVLFQHPKVWIDFMMRFELGLIKPEEGRAVRSAVTIGASYVAGGLIPLAPLHRGVLHANGSGHVRGLHPPGFDGLRLRQGAFHRLATAA